MDGNIGDQQLSTPLTVTLAGPPLQTGYLSDQQWLEASNFWGPVERDKSNGEQAAGDGKTITIGGKTYAKGLGVHAASSILFYNGAHCATLTSDIGVDDEETGNGKVDFQVWARRPTARRQRSRDLAGRGQDADREHRQHAVRAARCHQLRRRHEQRSRRLGGRATSPAAARRRPTAASSASVPATLSLSLGTPAAFGAFTPGVAKDYTAATTADVVSSAGDAALSVSDPSGTATGHLVNGAFSLASPLQVMATSPAGAGAAFAPLGQILTYSGPIAHDPVAITFKQSIGANEPLRTGSYSKTLTFTLSTTTP